MRFLIIGDLHGQKPVIHFTQFDAIIAPGDFCSDALRTVMFQALRKNLKNPNTNVRFLTHNVPFNTPIDEITDKNSPRVGYHFGSLLARELIEKHQPLVCIGGHMHEHFTSCRIGKTTAINAGFGSFVNVLLELQSNTIQKLEFHQKKS